MCHHSAWGCLMWIGDGISYIPMICPGLLVRSQVSIIFVGSIPMFHHVCCLIPHDPSFLLVKFQLFIEHLLDTRYCQGSSPFFGSFFRIPVVCAPRGDPNSSFFLRRRIPWIPLPLAVEDMVPTFEISRNIQTHWIGLRENLQETMVKLPSNWSGILPVNFPLIQFYDKQIPGNFPFFAIHHPSDEGNIQKGLQIYCAKKIASCRLSLKQIPWIPLGNSVFDNMFYLPPESIYKILYNYVCMYVYIYIYYRFKCIQ